jgi:23S rRNA (uracil1939-C5)-methyltransferase
MAVDETVELEIERAVAGGRMLARHAGKVVFVAGAIPGERVRARVTRSGRQSFWADTIDVIEPSPDRRKPSGNPACGGLAYAHISYERQRALKGQILADAFRRLARIDLLAPEVIGSPETGYRLRCRLHVAEGRAGFFLEGTHTLCDARQTRQLTEEAVASVEDAMAGLGSRAVNCEAVVVSENVAGTERVIHLEPRDGTRLDDAQPMVSAVAAARPGITGITTTVRGRLVVLHGTELVTDRADVLLADTPAMAGASWRRRPTSFFQGNRFLVGRLITEVLALAHGSRVADLYAGVGLFTVALAQRGSQVLAVEGDASSADDLTLNAEPWPSSVRITRSSIENYLRRPPTTVPDSVIVDPPRTGMSAEALDRLAAWGAPSIVYVSCDPPTLARDAARLSQQGYRLLSIQGLDMFPNTPHVETVAAFARP